MSVHSGNPTLSQEAQKLPAYEIADAVNQHLLNSLCLVVTAPPGAGKSTVLPLTILTGGNIDGKILMLEPRRLAARQVAERMAYLIGEKPGQTVGYRIRFENCVSDSTRIEVITEGILTRMLVDDPTLEGVSAVIFDEFHERSINSDLGLALVREAQSIIRPDLRIVVMSATIEASEICKALNTPLVESEGRMYDVEIINKGDIINRQFYTDDIANAVASTIAEAHAKHSGDILAFLPGQGEIIRCMDILGTKLGNTGIYPLYGLQSSKEQQGAIAPSKEGERKVVLATPVAETSLTIEGVRIVIDSGLCRKMVFDHQSGLSHLQTVPISMDMATQRCGRAGRVAEGVCYRLWSTATEHRMDECRTPEIMDTDLTPMLLDIAAWGEGDITHLSWLTTPPANNVALATDTLLSLNAIDDNGSITSLGRKMSKLPCHPRIAKMLITAETDELKSLATDIAALLEEKDPMANTALDADINSRIAELRAIRSRRQNARAWNRILREAEQYRRLIRCGENNDTPNPYHTGMLIASAFPERIGSAHKDGCGRYVLASGDLAFIDKDDCLAAQDWLAIANINVQHGKGHIFLASPLHPKDIKNLLREKENVSWDNKQGVIIARKEYTIGKLIVETRPIQDISLDKKIDVICEACTKNGLSMFDFNDKVQNLQRRIAAVSNWHPEMELPDTTNDAILEKAREWLPFYIGKASSANELKKIDMCAAIWSLLTYDQQQMVDKLAPTHIVVPTGSRIKVEYRQGAEQPILRVRLQECFGLQDTPKVDDGRRPILMELLSPGFKPVQLTQDLRSFWTGTYFEVRKELRRRYPKHYWPDNPLEAKANFK